MLSFCVALSHRWISSTFFRISFCVGRRIGLRKRHTRSRIFLEARRPVENMATSLPITEAAKAAQYWATENVLPKRRGVTIMTSVRNSSMANSRSSCASQRS